MNMIPFGALLKRENKELSVVSYNILLPNNIDGWWIPKCYPPQTPMEHRTWSHRKKKLIDYLQNTSADIICLQEVAQSSWEEDFQELTDKDYSGIIHSKNNLFRCATFYKERHLNLLETRHSFRSLVHLFEGMHGTFGVINVHLSGGPHPKTRMAQLQEALKSLKKLAVSYQLDTNLLPIILCGDFNCNPQNSPMSDFLFTGKLTPEERDPLYPDTALTKKGKKHAFSGFESIYKKALGKSPPTLFGRPLISVFCKQHTTQELLQARSNNKLASLINNETYMAIDSLFSIYEKGGIMDKEACISWVKTINGGLRGGEWKAVQNKNHTLRKQDFIDIYIQNMNHGLWWSLASDLEQHGISLPHECSEIYKDSLDHIFIRNCKPTGIQSPVLPTAIPNGLPCSDYPSDHIPVAAIVSLA